MLTKPLTESAKHNHHHHHHHDDDDTTLDLPNPHAAQDAEERFTRLLMMLEAQFGSEIAPIERPRLTVSSPNKDLSNGTATGPIKTEPEQTPTPFETKDTEDQDPVAVAKLEAAELARLHALGIPVPGLEIKVDKHTARVWLEDLEVECANAVLRDRVRVVIERAVETVASMWSSGSSSAVANGAKEYTENTVSKGLKLEAKA